MIHTGSTSRASAAVVVDRWESLPMIATTSARNDDVIDFSAVLGRHAVVRRVEAPPHCPGTSNSDPIWYVGRHRRGAATVRTGPAAAAAAVADMPSSPTTTRIATERQSSEDFGLSAARVRIQTRFELQQQQQQQHRATGDEEEECDDYDEDDDDQEMRCWYGSNDSMVLSNETASCQTKPVTTTRRAKKDRFKASQLINSTVNCAHQTRISHRKRRAYRGEAGTKVLSSTAGLPSSYDVTTAVASGKAIVTSVGGIDLNTRTAINVSKIFPISTSSRVPQSTPFSCGLKADFATVFGSQQEALLSYADPTVDASSAFNQRLAQMTALVAETKRTERLAVLAARAKKKQQQLHPVGAKDT